MKTSILVSKADAPYPRLKWLESSELVVLFSSASHGTVVNVGSSNHKLGLYSREWTSSAFKDFYGTVELEN